MAWLLSRRNRLSFLTANTVAGPLGRAHRSGRATGNHPDPPTAVLLPGWTHHPLGAAPHPAPAPALALGNPVHSRPHPIASPAAPFLMVAPATGPSFPSSSHSNVSPARARWLSECPMLPPTHPARLLRPDTGWPIANHQAHLPVSAPTIAPSSPSCPVPVLTQCPSVDSG